MELCEPFPLSPSPHFSNPTAIDDLIPVNITRIFPSVQTLHVFLVKHGDMVVASGQLPEQPHMAKGSVMRVQGAGYIVAWLRAYLSVATGQL